MSYIMKTHSTVFSFSVNDIQAESHECVEVAF